MIRRKRGRTTQEIPRLREKWFGKLAEILEARVGEKITQVAKGILVRHEVNAEFAAPCVEALNFLGRERAPAMPDAFIFFVGEGVLGIKLQLVDFEIGKLLGEIEQRLQLWHPATRDVEHDAAPREVRPVANF